MSLQETTLYTRAHDIVVWIVERARGWGDTTGPELAASVTRAALECLASIALGLTFKAGRVRHLLDADEGLLRLRIWLRVAAACGALDDRQLRYVVGELGEIGRMLGRWRQRIEQKTRAAPAH